MTKWNLLFVEGSLYPSYGGSKRFLVNLTSGLDRSRWEPQALFYRSGPWVEDLKRQEIWTGLVQLSPSQPSDPTVSPAQAGLRSRLRAGKTPLGDVRRSRARQVLSDARSLWSLYHRARLGADRLRPFLPPRVDLIHYNGPMHMAFEWYHLARRLGVPLLTRENGIWRRPPAACRIVAPRLAAAICLTEERVEALRRWGHGRVLTALVPNGISLERLRPSRSREDVREELGIGPRTVMIITPGHLQPWKGQYLCAEAAVRLLNRSRDFVWVFCGSWLDVAYVEKLERRVREAGLEMHVRILPEREDLPDLYSAADVAVLASIHPDPFPNVALEAMGSGLPLVAPKEGALAHVIRDERDGLHFTPRDADSLASALAALLSSPERRAEFGASARARVLADFTLQSMVNGHCRVYQEVLGG